MATAAGGSVAVSSFPSTSYLRRRANSSSLTVTVGKPAIFRQRIACSAVQESSTPTVATEAKAKKEQTPATATEKPAATETKGKKEATPAKEPAARATPAKPKPAAKAKVPDKPLPQLMEEDVIPSLKATLESQDEISEVELSFADSRLEGSFLKAGIPYSFWAFFPNGVLTGPKGFSLSSYGSGVSTIEPFLIDEKKITAKHIVFWVEKRLAAQGIIPVWRNDYS